MKTGLHRTIAALLVLSLTSDPHLAATASLCAGDQAAAVLHRALVEFGHEALTARPWIARVLTPIRQGIAVWRQMHRSRPIAAPILWFSEELVFRDLTHRYLGSHTALVFLISVGLFSVLHHDFVEDPP
jgi:hypothetical protein